MGTGKTRLTVLLVLTLVLVSFSHFEVIEAQGKMIYIKGDGSVEGTDKIVQLVYGTYTFTDNIFGEIIVQRSNFVLDGAGYTLQGNWSGFHPDNIESRGITLSDRSNIMIKNLRILNFTYGINCVLSNNNTITNCYIENCQRSINQPSNVLITNNTILSEIYLDYTHSDNTITKNNFISKDSPASNLIAVYFAPQPTVFMNYWSDYNGTDTNRDGIGDTPYVINQDNQDNSPLMNQVDMGIIPQDNIIYIRADGTVEGTDKIRRDGDVFTLMGDIYGGIDVERNFTIIDGAGFALKGNGKGAGIDLRSTDGPLITNVTIKNLIITDFEYGVFSSTNNTFIGNYISDCFCGINILGGSNSLIVNNTLMNNGNPISIAYSGGNHSITRNNIVNGTTIIVWLSAQPNVFMNYWSDYNGTDVNGDGIGDTPYVYINADYAKLSDNYPLIEPVPTIPEFPSWTILPLFLTATSVVFIVRNKIRKKN